MSTGFHTVHVRVNDAATGQPTPVRVRFTGPDGEYLAPFGRLTEFATGDNEDVGGNLQLGENKYAYTDGSFEIALPVGPISVEITKGYEYWPVRETIDLPAGKMALRFSIGRWADLSAQGWCSGDTRLHFISPHAALLEAAAEDVSVANLLAAETFLPSFQVIREVPHEERLLRYPAIPNLLAFSGQQPALTAPGRMVVVNTLNQHEALGKLALLNSHRVVHPLGFGEGRGDNWTLAAWCDQCHRKGGLALWSDARRHPDAAFGETLADMILGKIDAIEATVPAAPGRAATGEAIGLVPEPWYALLNCGFRVPLVGGSGKRSNRQPVGVVRTYARLLPGQDLTYRNWIEAIRFGRAFATAGPLLTLTVNGQDPGSEIRVRPKAGTVQVAAHARSRTQFRELQLVVNGYVALRSAATELTSSSPATAVIESDLELTGSGWIAARCAGKDPAEIIAHTSPVYFEREGELWRPGDASRASEHELHAWLDRSLDWVSRSARCESDRQRENLASIFHSAKNILLHRAAGL